MIVIPNIPASFLYVSVTLIHEELVDTHMKRWKRTEEPAIVIEFQQVVALDLPPRHRGDLSVGVIC